MRSACGGFRIASPQQRLIPVIEHDVIIVGAGLAGLRAAIGLADVADVALLSRVHPTRSHSVAAQGGVNASLGNMPGAEEDTPDAHAFDTVKGSDYLADQDAAAVLCHTAPEIVFELEHWGCPFSRLDDGRIAQRPFGGQGVPRTCYAADRTGHAMLHTLFEQATRRGVTRYDEWLALRLAVADGRCHGLAAMNLLTGRVEPLRAKAVVFATGGYGRVYGKSTNALICTGAGIGMAYRASAALKDMEFVQFHPTTLFGSNILITEGARGEGGHLKNSDGERFMERYAAQAMELAPRDIVARAIQTEIDEGRGIGEGYVHLDLRHLGAEKIKARLPGIREIAIDFAHVDPIDEPIPVQPGQHYSMGGIDVDVHGATAVEGFFAAGECACVSVHGANRLGGNSLLETVVFGKRVGGHLRERVGDLAMGDKPVVELAEREVLDEIDSLSHGPAAAKTHEVNEALGIALRQGVGVFREDAAMRRALDEIRELRGRARGVRVTRAAGAFNWELVAALELPLAIDVAEAIAAGALARTESRGSHSRTDHPERRDEEWLKHTIATHSPDGLRLDYKPVTLGKFEPQERKY